MSDEGNKLVQDAVPPYVVVMELVSPAVLLALNLSFLKTLPEEFGAGFQTIPMLLAEVVLVLSACMVAYVIMFVLLRNLIMRSLHGVMWSYIFVGLWARIITAFAILAVGCGVFKWVINIELCATLVPGPFIWGFFAGCFGLAARARIRQLTKSPFFAENDRRIREGSLAFEPRFGFNFVVKRKMGLKDMPFALLVMLIFFLVGLALLVVGITAVAENRLSAAVPLLFGLIFAGVSFYWLGALGSHIRGKSVTLISWLETKSASGVKTAAPIFDPLAGQRTILAVLGVLSLVPLGMASVQATWTEFVFAIVAGETGFIGLEMMRRRLERTGRRASMEKEEWARFKRRFARRGCDYGLILLVGGLLVETVVPPLISWGTGSAPVVAAWWEFAFPVWAWLMLASISSWYERSTRELWSGQDDVPPALKLAEIITWPFQVFSFLNPWEVILKFRSRMKNTDE